MWVCIYRRNYARALLLCVSIFCVRPLHVCSFNEDGQSRASECGTSKTVRSSRISFLTNKLPTRSAQRQFFLSVMFLKRAVFWSFLFCAFSASAEDKKPCLIFSGHSGADYAVDLSKFNRIRFDSESMTLTGPDDGGNRLEMLYSAYNCIKVGECEPSGIKEVTEHGVRLVYDRTHQSITIVGTREDVYTVGVFNMCGVLVFRSEIKTGASVSVDILGKGTYIAVLTGKESVQPLKFIK